MFAGVGALLGSAVLITIAAVILGSNPDIQEFIRRSEPHPEARIPYEWIAPLAAGTGLLVGLIVGIGNLFLAALGAFIAGLVAPQRRNT